MISVAKTMDFWISMLASKTTCMVVLRLSSGCEAVDAQPAEDVLDENDRVVHQRADGDGHAAQRHGVDGGAEGLHDQNRDQRARAEWR